MERRAIHDEQHKGGTPRGAHGTTDIKRRGTGREGRGGRGGKAEAEGESGKCTAGIPRALF